MPFLTQSSQSGGIIIRAVCSFLNGYIFDKNFFTLLMLRSICLIFVLAPPQICCISVELCIVLVVHLQFSGSYRRHEFWFVSVGPPCQRRDRRQPGVQTHSQPQRRHPTPSTPTTTTLSHLCNTQSVSGHTSLAERAWKSRDSGVLKGRTWVMCGPEKLELHKELN